jgi:hypothetical protein
MMATCGPFSGAGYDSKLDHGRLTLQVERIRSYMLRAGWQTLRELKLALEQMYAPASFPESSLSAQLRNLRKPKLCYRVEKRRRAGVHGPGAGIWEYRLLPPAQMELAEIKYERPRPRADCGDARTEPDDGKGREEFFRTARRIAGLS